MSSSRASTRYDALNRVIQQIEPHSSLPGTKFNIVQPIYNEANLLEKVDAWLQQPALPAGLLAPSSATLHAVVNIDYDAKGQRMRIDYNAEAAPIVTEYAYDPDTFRLVRLQTVRPLHPVPGERLLQDLSYTYDPAGNITHIEDAAQQIDLLQQPPRGAEQRLRLRLGLPVDRSDGARASRPGRSEPYAQFLQRQAPRGNLALGE